MTKSVKELPSRSWEQLAAAGHLAEAVVEYVRGCDWVTLVELESRFKPYLETQGEIAWGTEGCGVVLWAGMSREFLSLLIDLVERKRLFLHPASYLTYFIDGGGLKLPLAKRPPTNGYKKDRWLPVCLRVVPLP